MCVYVYCKYAVIFFWPVTPAIFDYIDDHACIKLVSMRFGAEVSRRITKTLRHIIFNLNGICNGEESAWWQGVAVPEERSPMQHVCPIFPGPTEHTTHRREIKWICLNLKAITNSALLIGYTMNLPQRSFRDILFKSKCKKLGALKCYPN